MIDTLPRVGAKTLKNLFNGMTIFRFSFCKKGQVINKEEVRDVGTPLEIEIGV